MGFSEKMIEGRVGMPQVYDGCGQEPMCGLVSHPKHHSQLTGSQEPAQPMLFTRQLHTLNYSDMSSSTLNRKQKG